MFFLLEASGSKKKKKLLDTQDSIGYSKGIRESPYHPKEKEMKLTQIIKNTVVRTPAGVGRVCSSKTVPTGKRGRPTTLVVVQLRGEKGAFGPRKEFNLRDVQVGATPPRRGRPLGSKNAPKVQVQTPVETPVDDSQEDVAQAI